MADGELGRCCGRRLPGTLMLMPTLPLVPLLVRARLLVLRTSAILSLDTVVMSPWNPATTVPYTMTAL